VISFILMKCICILVVGALAPVLRGKPGRNPGDADAMTRDLSWRSIRVLAFG